jgi:hypothetical protein
MMGAKKLIVSLLILAAGICLLSGAKQEWTPTVVINEVAWMGTPANAADEWIELYNVTEHEIDLSGWTLTWGEGEVTIYLSEVKEGTKEIRNSIIPAHGFYVLERTDDTTVSDVEADLIFKGALDNAGESLILKDAAGEIVDTANIDGGEWPGGVATGGELPYASMERIAATKLDADDNWGTTDGQMRNGLDAAGNQLNGTPGQPNSVSR